MSSRDYLSQAGAEIIRKRLERYWQRSSAGQVSFWVEGETADKHAIFGVRSSLVNGMPGPLTQPSESDNGGCNEQA